MQDSLLTSLYSLLDQHPIGSVADALGTSEQSALHGFKVAIAAVLGGLLGKAEDLNILHAVLRLSPAWCGGISREQLAREAVDPNSPMLSAGRQILSALFGPSQAAVANAVGAASGLQVNEASRVLALTASLATRFIANRIGADGMNMHALGRRLQSESASIRTAQPASLQDLLQSAGVMHSSTLAARAVERERPPANWLPLLALIILIPALVWLFSHTRKAGHEVGLTPKELQTAGSANPASSTRKPGIGTADRAETDPVELARRLLVNNVDLKFDTGSARLQPDSRGQLDMIASTITTYPDVHLTLTGHTDKTGDADANRRLSRKRANAVMAELIRKGVPADHLSSESQEQPGTIADNATEEGRAKNRCVTLDVSQH